MKVKQTTELRLVNKLRELTREYKYLRTDVRSFQVTLTLALHILCRAEQLSRRTVEQ